MLLKTDKNKLRQKRHLRVRNHIHDTAQLDILSVLHGGFYFYAQIIDKNNPYNILIKEEFYDKTFSMDDNVMLEGAKKVGAAIAKKALAAGITEVDFDSYRFPLFICDCVDAFAFAAREAGLKF